MASRLLSEGFEAPRGWMTLGRCSPLELVESRLQLHWAVQALAAFGETLVDKRPDDSHASLGWDERLEAFVTRAAPSYGGYKAGLRLTDLQLMLIPDAKEPSRNFSLVGKSYPDAVHWLQETLQQRLSMSVPTLARPGYDMPHHPTAEAGQFELNRGLVELSSWFHNAHQLFAREVRIWPHHFDLACLVVLNNVMGQNPAPRIGIGLSPGDHLYGEPYYYVTPWPHPERPSYEPLPSGGIWRDQGWFGAVLPASQIVMYQQAPGSRESTQALAIIAFLRAALKQSQNLVAAAQAQMPISPG